MNAPSPVDTAPIDTATAELRLTRLLPGPIERVWSFFMEPDKLKAWLAIGSIEPRLGGKVDLLFKHDSITDEPHPAPWRDMMEKGVTMTGQVLAYDPPRRLAFSWGEQPGGQVTFDLEPVGGEVRLTLVQNKAKPGDGNLGGWMGHLQALEDVTHGRRCTTFWKTVLKHQGQ